MGLDLRLLPFECDLPDMAFSHSILSCERRRDLFEELLKLPFSVVPDEFYTFLCRDESYDDNHYGITKDTPYGEPLAFVQVEALIRFSNHIDVRDNAQNRAVWAFLRELDPHTKIALYWH